MPASISVALPHKALGSLLLPLGLIVALSAGVVLQTGVISFSAPSRAEPAVITVEPGSFAYRQPGEFYRSGFAVDAPKAEETANHSLTIMKYQVSTLDYDACVADGACPARETTTASRADMPGFSSINRSTFSTTTIASSTSRPIASVSPNRVIVLMLKPNM